MDFQFWMEHSVLCSFVSSCGGPWHSEWSAICTFESSFDSHSEFSALCSFESSFCLSDSEWAGICSYDILFDRLSGLQSSVFGSLDSFVRLSYWGFSVHCTLFDWLLEHSVTSSSLDSLLSDSFCLILFSILFFFSLVFPFCFFFNLLALFLAVFSSAFFLFSSNLLWYSSSSFSCK